MIVSFITGALTTFGLFLFCLIIVVGIKTVYYTLKRGFIKKQPYNTPTQAPTQKSVVKPKRTVRTIEIDPDLADRIYFKKSS